MATVSRTDIGETGEDGVTRDSDGNVLPHIDPIAAQSLRDLLKGPQVREVPSEMDALRAAGALKNRPQKPEDSQQSGTLADVEASTKK